MIPKKNRADKKAIQTIFKKGKFLVSSNFTFNFVIDYTSKNPRISFIVPKSVSKLAVKRNFLRRVGYGILEKYIHRFPLGITGVFVFKKYQEDILIIEDEIKKILNKIN